MTAKTAKTSRKGATKASSTTAKVDKPTKKASTSLLKMNLDAALVQKAVEALLKHHEKTSEKKNQLLGNDRPVELLFTLVRASGKPSAKPVRVLIPHPIYQTATEGDAEANKEAEEPEICLIVKEESKAWCQAMIEKFPDHLGCVKKVLGLQSLRKKHALYEQRRALLHKYNIFMADDRILPMLSKALGSDFYKAKKLPIPIKLTRKEALPFAVQKALSATYMTINKGTCINIKAGHTGMSSKALSENIVEISQNAVPKLPHKWVNVQAISIKTPESIALPIYSKTPEVLREIAKLAGIVEKVPPEEPINETKEEEKKKKRKEAKSPLLQALKKQKTDEKATKTEKKTKSRKKVLKEEESATKAEKSKKSKKSDESPESTPRKSKRQEAAKKEPENKKEVASKKEKQSSQNKDAYIAAKKYKGSKKGYVFKMGQEGLGYYIDVKPSVDHIALQAITASRGKSRSSSQGRQKKGKGKYKGTRKF